MKGQNLYFSAMFSKYLDEWLSGNITDENGITRKRTQADFAKKVGIHPNMITRYKKGDAYPQDHERMEWIAEALNVDVNDFIPTTPTERLAFDEKYRMNFQNEVLDLELQMIESIGIDLGFWKFFISIDNIYDMFPFEKVGEWESGMVAGKNNSQGQKVGFTKNDLLFVKHLQDESETTISVLLIKELMKKSK